MSAISSPFRSYPSRPAFSSPLAPRSPNIQAFPSQMASSPQSKPKPFFSSPIKPPTTPQQNPSLSGSIFEFADTTPSTRRTDPRIPQRRLQGRNPLVRSAEMRQFDTRRRYLDDVKGKREDSVWTARSDQVHRRSFFEEQKQWEALQSKEAEAAMGEVEEEDDDLQRMLSCMYDGQPREVGLRRLEPLHIPAFAGASRSNSLATQIDLTRNEADAVEEAERNEMNALIALHEQDNAKSPAYGSDEEGWDAAMLEIAGVDDGALEEMDMS